MNKHLTGTGISKIVSKIVFKRKSTEYYSLKHEVYSYTVLGSSSL